MDETAELSPVQREVLEALGAASAERPAFDSELRTHLRDRLEHEIGELLEHLGPTTRLPLWVSKHALATVHTCEGKLVAEERAEFSWNVAIATGSVAHRAIELGINWDGDPAPRLLVDAAVASIETSTDNLGDWLVTLDDRERAELRSRSVEKVAAFAEMFPPLQPRWRPVCESRVRAEFHGGDVRMSGKVDLTLGTAHGNVAGKVLIDFKTGSAQSHHLDDLRFYALLETLARGTPPRLLATAYLDSGRLRTETVTEELLGAALRRTIDGTGALAALRIAGDAPHLSPGPSCRWCPALGDCDAGTAWLADDGDPERFDPD